jgi:hypothetical protein
VQLLCILTHDPSSGRRWNVLGFRECVEAARYSEQRNPRAFHLKPTGKDHMTVAGRLAIAHMPTGRQYIITDKVGSYTWRTQTSRNLTKDNMNMQVMVSSSWTGKSKLRTLTNDVLLRDHLRRCALRTDITPNHTQSFGGLTKGLQTLTNGVVSVLHLWEPCTPLVV